MKEKQRNVGNGDKDPHGLSPFQKLVPNLRDPNRR